ncbi:MAG: shikimate dehydrogenase [Candidatus Sericytochromatia bacterium]|nr:shikimate dehydrogenase [Candidatus Sericytochromatia bacterium]
MPIDQHTRMVGLLGYPLQHSFSPLMHNGLFEALEMNFVYLPLRVQPGQLGDAMLGLRACQFVGANVTIPHKEQIIPFLDLLTPEAELVGAVNTLFWNAERQLVGDNTDVEGFRRSLAKTEIGLEGRSVAIIGSGGAARAVAVALARQQVKEIIFLARRQSAVQQVIQDLSPLFPEIVWTPHTQPTAVFAEDLERVWLLVNASPVGMFPAADQSPLSYTMLGMLPKGAHVYDLVYNPAQTELLKRAADRGLQTHTGLDMLAYQGAVAFERWTGVYPPVARMLKSIEAQLNDYPAET